MTVAKRKTTSRDIRSDSRRVLLHALLDARHSTRAELAQNTDLSQATVATIVGELLAEGIIMEAGTSSGTVGRPTMTLQINPSRGRIVGIDEAETYVRAVVFDASLTQIGSFEIPRDEHELGPSYVAEGIGIAFDRALEATETTRDSILGVGVTLPGLVQRSADGTSLVVRRRDYDDEMIRLLRDRLGSALIVDNPLKAVASAELWFGAGRDASSMVVLNLGTGVGAGIVLDGRVVRGFTNSAGEWGHTRLVLDGRRCRCGRRGCVEAYIGGYGLQETLREIDPKHSLAAVPLQQDFIVGLAEAFQESEPAVVEALRRTARYLGAAIADLVAIINPERVVLTGWIAWALGDVIAGPAREHLLEFAPDGSADGIALGISSVRGNPAALGIATTVFERFLGDIGLLTAA